MQSTIRIFLFSLSFFIFSTAQAQLEKVMHQTFEVGEVETISLDLVGEYDVEEWAGNTIMTETKVQLYEASPAILNHFVTKAKRYEISADTLDRNLLLASMDKERKPIRTKTQECYELVKLKIFVPDTFEMTGDSVRTLVKKKVD